MDKRELEIREKALALSEKELNAKMKELDAKRKDLELKRKALEEEEAKLAKNELMLRKTRAEKKWSLIRQYRDVVLALVDHDFSSCSDNYTANGWRSDPYSARCNKCVLIEVLNGYWGDDKFDVSFKLNIEEIQ